jgi:hypothetical protein
MSWLLLTIQITIAATFLLAATGKILRPSQFEFALGSLGLTNSARAQLQIEIPLIEIAVAAAVLFATTSSLAVAFGLAVALIAAFTVWMVWVTAHGLAMTCGCFGTGSGEVGRRTIARNVVLIVLSGSGFVFSMKISSPLPEPTPLMAVVVSASGLVLMLVAALRITVPRLVLTLDDLRSQTR